MTKKTFINKLRRHALKLPESEEGVSCNKSAFKARKKAFFYLGEKDDSVNVMLKLNDSIPDAESLGEEFPGCIKVGQWVQGNFGADNLPPTKIICAWIEESYRLLVHKDLVAQMKPSRKR